ncbi:MAG: DUF58 domain-containing protein [Candidatus Gallimonas sp.]
MNELPIDEAFLQQVETLQTLLKHNAAGLFGGNHQSRTYGSSCEFADYRDYIPGDDIKRVDWNAFARFDRLYLKLYLDERQLHTRIYIDASKSMAYGNGKKDVQAIRIAATIAYLSVCEMDKVSIYAVVGGQTQEILSGLHGKEAYFASIGKLNDVVFDGESRLSEALLPASVGYGDGLSVILSDFLTDENYEDGIDRLAERKRDILCVQILSKEELNPKLRGKMHLYDSENHARFYRKNINREVVRAYRLALEYATDRIRGFCASRGADYLLVSAEDSVHKIFFEKLTDMGVLK